MGHPVVPVPDSVERALSPTFQQPIGGRQKAKASPSCAVLLLRATFQRSRGIIYKKAGPFFSGTPGSALTVCPPHLRRVPCSAPQFLLGVNNYITIYQTLGVFDHSLEIEHVQEIEIEVENFNPELTLLTLSTLDFSSYSLKYTSYTSWK